MIISLSSYISVGKDTFAKMLQYHAWKKVGVEHDFQTYEWWLKQPDTNKAKWSGWEIKKFATKLKQITCILTGCTMEQMESQEFKSGQMPREWDWVKVKWMQKDEYEQLRPEFQSLWEFTSGGYRRELRFPMTYREFLQRLGTEALRECIHPDVHVNALFADYRLKNHLVPGELLSGTKFPDWILTDSRFPNNEFKAVKDRGGILIRLVSDKPRTSDHISETSMDSFSDWDEVVSNNDTLEELLEKAEYIVRKYNM